MIQSISPLQQEGPFDNKALKMLNKVTAIFFLCLFCYAVVVEIARFY